MSILEKPIEGTLSGWNSIDASRTNVIIPDTLMVEIMNILLAYCDKHQLNKLEQLAYDFSLHIATYGNPHNMETSHLVGDLLDSFYEKWIDAGYVGTRDDMTEIIFRYIEITDDRADVVGTLSNYKAPTVNLFDHMYRVLHNEGTDVHTKLIKTLFSGAVIYDDINHTINPAISTPLNCSISRSTPSTIVSTGYNIERVEPFEIKSSLIYPSGSIEVNEGYKNYTPEQAMTGPSWERNGVGVVEGSEIIEHSGEGNHYIGRKFDPAGLEKHTAVFFIGEHTTLAIIAFNYVTNKWEPVAVASKHTSVAIKEGYSIRYVRVGHMHKYVVTCTDMSVSVSGYGISFLGEGGEYVYTGKRRITNLFGLMVADTLFNVPFITTDTASPCGFMCVTSGKISSTEGTFVLFRDLPQQSALEGKTIQIAQFAGNTHNLIFELTGKILTIKKVTKDKTVVTTYSCNNVGLIGETITFSFRYVGPRFIIDINDNHYEFNFGDRVPVNPNIKLDSDFNGCLFGSRYVTRLIDDEQVAMLDK